METKQLRTKVRIRPIRTYPNAFLAFWGNLFNFSGNLYEYSSESTQDGDAKALADDWKAVGEDLSSAMSAYETKYKVKRSRTLSHN